MRVGWLLLAGLFVAAAHGAQPQGVAIELNKLEQKGGDCRLYMLFKNQDARAFESLKLDLVAFDQQSIVSQRLVLEGGPLPAEKTLLKAFELSGVQCKQLSRLLLNGVLACETGTDEAADCLRLVRPSSRTDVEFIQ